MGERLIGFSPDQDLPEVFSTGTLQRVSKGHFFGVREKENVYHGVVEGMVGIFVSNSAGNRSLSYVAKPGDFYNPSNFTIKGQGIMVEGIHDSVIQAKTVDVAAQDSETRRDFLEMQVRIIKGLMELQHMRNVGLVINKLAYVVQKIGEPKRMEGQEFLYVTSTQGAIAAMVGNTRQEVCDQIGIWQESKIVCDFGHKRDLYFSKAAMNRCVRQILARPMID